MSLLLRRWGWTRLLGLGGAAAPGLTALHAAPLPPILRMLFVSLSLERAGPLMEIMEWAFRLDVAQTVPLTPTERERERERDRGRCGTDLLVVQLGIQASPPLEWREVLRADMGFWVLLTGRLPRCTRTPPPAYPLHTEAGVEQVTGVYHRIDGKVNHVKPCPSTDLVLFRPPFQETGQGPIVTLPFCSVCPARRGGTGSTSGWQPPNQSSYSRPSSASPPSSSRPPSTWITISVCPRLTDPTCTPQCRLQPSRPKNRPHFARA